MTETERMLCYEATVVNWYADGDTYYEPEKGVEYNFKPDHGGYEDAVYSVRGLARQYVVGLYYDITFESCIPKPRPVERVRRFVSASEVAP